MKRTSQQRTRGRRRQRGIALILCLFALILLSSIALGLIYMSDTETLINRNFRSSQQAYFAANAGLEEARSRLTPGLASPPGIAPPPMPGAGPGWLIYIRNPKVVNGTLESVDPLNPDLANPYYDTELCHENYGFGLPLPAFDTPCAPQAMTGIGAWTYLDSTSPGTKTTSALNFKWVRINVKTNASGAHGGIALGAAGGLYVDGGGDPLKYNTQVCWDGGQELLLPAGYTACDVPPPAASAGVIYKPVVILTSLAQGSRRITQMEVAQNPPIITNAAVDSKDHVSLKGALSVNGYDFCSCQEKHDATGKVIGYESRPGKTCDASKWAIYAGGPIDDVSGNSEALVAGPNPPAAENQPWIYDIAEMVDSYKNTPQTINVTTSSTYKWSCPLPDPPTPNSNPNCGTQSGASFGIPPNFPPSPVDNPIGPANMAVQYTYVPGDVHLTGNSQGNGVLVVDGDLTIDGGLQFYGLILVKGIIKFTGGGSQKTNIYGAVIAGEKSIDEITDTTLGGSANIQFDYCSLLDKRPPQPPTVISFRELTY